MVRFAALFHWLRNPRKAWSLLRLHLRAFLFARRHAFLRGRAAPDPKRIALFVSLTDWVAQVKLEGMLGTALALRGVTPAVLTWRSSRLAHAYFRAFGITTFYYLDDYLDALPHEEADAILNERSTFGSLLAFVERDIRIGNHVLSTAVRKLRGGSGTFHDAPVQALLKHLLPSSLRTARGAVRFFAKIRPEIVLFLEKGYSPYGEVFDAAIAQGIPCIQYVHSQRADALVLKRYTKSNATMHPFSLSQKTWDRVRAMAWAPHDEQAFRDELRRSYAEGLWFNRKFLLDDKKIKTPEEVRSQLKLHPSKKTVVIFSHVLWDATFFFGKTLFADYEEWLVETVKAACKNTAVNWVIKLHPDYVWKMKMMGETGDPRDVIALQSNIGTLPSHIQVVPATTDISTYSFFAITDYAITVRGTIGIEAPCFGIPLFTAGTGRYSGLGFTEDSATREEYLQKMARIQDFPPMSAAQTSLALRHAHALFDLRPLTFDSFTYKRGAKSGTDDTVIRLHSFREMTEAADLRTFASWVLDSHDEDYLAPLP